MGKPWGGGHGSPGRVWLRWHGAGSHVHLHLYDITMGLAAKLSPGLLGKPIPAIYPWVLSLPSMTLWFFFGGTIC